MLPLADDDDADTEWYWTLYNQSLNPVLRALVGEIYTLSLAQQDSGQKEQ
ncbi:YscQ/HrcQ family type III secretion apparatus protein, partial [Pectobacterium carotovorum subsp. carotovorum]